MDDNVAIGAIRRVATDVANLTGQLALAQSGVEYVRSVAKDLVPETWDRHMSDGDSANGQHPEMLITLKGDQADAVMRLLAALDTLG